MDLAFEGFDYIEYLLGGDVPCAVEGVDWEVGLLVGVSSYAIDSELVKLVPSAGLSLGVLHLRLFALLYRVSMVGLLLLVTRWLLSQILVKFLF